ncbi:ATP-binding protein [Arundinibacter roseus]|uniref:AAA+ ATPase domain-containing protein n=1 Tax=Arundinibacter roseus TaxID=2070510 RepID=A0A4R4K7I0_9BACT|nr:ATP-binding protein [Arundinibacter roseus]TDB63303.1 hypothetical protein EZE20_16140 [Arundinibacter roseus]
MKLKLSRKFKSLEPFEIECPDLTIITGINGSGKSQLLEGILNKEIKILGCDEKDFLPIKLFKNYDFTMVIEDKNFNSDNLHFRAKDLYSLYSRHLNIYEFSYNSPDAEVKKNLIETFPENEKIIEIADKAKKNIIELTEQDFINFLPLNANNDLEDIFNKGLNYIFQKYYYFLEQNHYAEFLSNKNTSDEIKFLSDDDFSRIYGEKPWDIVNKLLSNSRLNLQVNYPKYPDKISSFSAKFVNKSGVEINSNELSSGEKVLISFYLAVFNSNLDLPYPKLLLLDEPDSSLHPEMSKIFLNLIIEDIVARKGIKVIIATHSASTVAFAPEDSIFSINKDLRSIEKISKSKALKNLTYGVPSFSINYENRRQVFVESENDVKYFEKIYECLRKILEPEISLGFISSGNSKINSNGIGIANCDQVKNITNLLRSYGNSQIWGIIDSDNKLHKPEIGIVILGKGKRYSIENYILDPILIAIFLLKQNIVTNIELGLHEVDKYGEVKYFDSIKLQKIANFVIESIVPMIKSSDSSISTCKLINGMEIEIPNWYLKYQGHDLEKIIRSTFAPLNEFCKNKEDALKLQILNHIVNEFPQFLSSDVLETFKDVQSLD